MVQESGPRRRGNHKKWLDLAFSKGKQVRMPYHLKQLMLDFLGKQRKINGLSLYHHFYPFMGQISPTPYVEKQVATCYKLKPMYK